MGSDSSILERTKREMRSWRFNTLWWETVRCSYFYVEVQPKYREIENKYKQLYLEGKMDFEKAIEIAKKEMKEVEEKFLKKHPKLREVFGLIGCP